MALFKILCLFILSLVLCQSEESVQLSHSNVAKQIRHWIYLNVEDQSQKDARDMIEIMLEYKFPKLSFLVIVYASDFGLNQHHTNADVQISR